MEYEKDKIRRLIDYKDKITDNDIKNDLEWILGAYNEYYANSNEIETKQKEYGIIIKKYYDAEDEKFYFKKELDLIKKKYNIIKRNYRELEVKYKESCKKLKSMI